MNKRIRSVVAPLTIFVASVSLWGCDSSVENSTSSSNSSEQGQTVDKDISSLKSGNMLYIIRDVADMQLKTGNYLEQLKQSQNDLQLALDTQDKADLQQSINTLTQQLKGLNSSLNALNLKTQEVETIRQQVLELNQQALKMPLLNGKADLSQVNFDQIQEQLDTIQFDMLQLATLVIPSADSDSVQSTEEREK